MNATKASMYRVLHSVLLNPEDGSPDQIVKASKNSKSLEPPECVMDLGANAKANAATIPAAYM